MNTVMMVAMQTSPHEPGQRLLEPEVARVVGVRSVWLDPMVRHLRLPAPVGARNGVRQWDLDAVEDWLWGHELSRLAPIISERALRWLVLRTVTRRPAASLEADGVSRKDVEQQTVRLAVHLISRVPYQVQQKWDGARQSGSPDREIGTRDGVGVSLVRLVLDGIPKPVPGGRVNPYLLRGLWDEGLSIPVIAQRIGHSVARTRQEIDQAGDFLAPRLTAKDIAARFGWARTNVRGRRLRPNFPNPDGHPTATTTPKGKGTWWWAATIDQWEAGVTLRTCRVCGARVERLGTHRKLKH